MNLNMYLHQFILSLWHLYCTVTMGIFITRMSFKRQMETLQHRSLLLVYNGVSLYKLRLNDFDSTIHNTVSYRYGISIGSNTRVYCGTVRCGTVPVHLLFVFAWLLYGTVRYSTIVQRTYILPYGNVRHRLPLIGVLLVIDPVELH